MKLRYRGYLTEATFNLDKDVNYVYDKSGFDKIVKAVQSQDQRIMWSVLGRIKIDDIMWRSDSSKLTTKIAKKAHKLNPVSLRAGVFKLGSYYKPFGGTISFSINNMAYSILVDNNYDIKVVNAFLAQGQEDRFWNEFSEKNIKATIYHELVHWADDTLHNQFIYKTLTKAQEAGIVGQRIIKGKYTRVTHTPMEINAQIHALKAIKGQMGKRAYDNMNWQDLFTVKPSLLSNFRGFKDEADYDSMMRRFVKRLDRESLLGKGLRKIPSFKQMNHIFANLGVIL